MKRSSLAWFVVGLVVAGSASVAINARRGSRTSGNHGRTGGALPLSHASELRLRQAWQLPDLRHGARSRSEAQAASGAVPGRASLALSLEKRQALGIRSEEIHHGRLTRAIRTVGRVAVDERRLHHIHTKYDGYVEHLYVDFTGKYVERGDHLLSIYSPELVATQQEYLLAYNAQKQMAASGIPSVAQGSLDLLEAARQRLLLWDMRDEDIDALERAGKVSRTIDLHSEVAGYVVQKMAFHGMRVTPADTLFDIADLSQVWVLADVYESDLPLVRVGMMGELTVPYLPGKTWRGAVTYVGPTVEEKTRTVKVRIELRNEGQQLKPDMFADVSLQRGPRNGPVRPGERRDRQRGPQARVHRPGRGQLRAARGAARRAGRQRLPGPLRARGRRAGGDLGQLPAGLRVEPAVRPVGHGDSRAEVAGRLGTEEAAP